MSVKISAHSRNMGPTCTCFYEIHMVYTWGCSNLHGINAPAVQILGTGVHCHNAKLHEASMSWLLHHMVSNINVIVILFIQ